MPRPRILVVDDEPGMLMLTRLLIEDALPHADVLEARSAVEGLATLAREHVDVIVSDYRMPDMDGLRFLTKAAVVRSRILLTALADPAVRQQAAGAGVSFVEKSRGPQVLVEAVQRALA